MSTRFEKIATGAMAIAAILVAVKYVSTPKPTQRPNTSTPSYSARAESNWALATRYAIPHAVDVNRLTVLEFIDLECPFCAQYSRTIDSAQRLLGDTISVHYVNMPIGGHRFARSGAAAVECASRSGRTREFVSTSYANSDSIGLWSWARMAAEAGVVDTAAFTLCLSEPAVLARVDSARDAARELEIPGTPTILVQGWRYDMPPRLDRLLGDVRRLHAGKSLVE